MTTYQDRARRDLIERLPYGSFSDPDGREVLINRYYQPIWQRLGGQPATRADPVDWLPVRVTQFFYEPGHPPWREEQGRKWGPHDWQLSRQARERCEQVLADWGVM